MTFIIKLKYKKDNKLRDERRRDERQKTVKNYITPTPLKRPRLRFFDY